jgi:plasmid rolling circle replication initiator protein Rep
MQPSRHIKTVPWHGYLTTTRAKAQAQKLAAIYYRAGAEVSPYYTRKAQRVAMCGDTVVVQDRNIVSQWNCEDRLCPICQIKSARRIAANARAVLDKVCAESNVQPYMLTLTQKNCSAEALKGRIDDMLAAWRAIIKNVRGLKKYLAGYARTIEITVARDGSYHPHVHGIMLLSYDAPLEMKRSRYWALLWQEYMHTQQYQESIIPICDMRRIRPNRRKNLTSDAAAAAEVAKYCAKSSQILSQPDNYNKILTIDAAISGRRLRSYGGIWKVMRARLKLEDNGVEPPIQYIASAPTEIWQWAGAEYRRII